MQGHFLGIQRMGGLDAVPDVSDRIQAVGVCFIECTPGAVRRIRIKKNQLRGSSAVKRLLEIIRQDGVPPEQTRMCHSNDVNAVARCGGILENPLHDVGRFGLRIEYLSRLRRSWVVRGVTAGSRRLSGRFKAGRPRESRNLPRSQTTINPQTAPPNSTTIEGIFLSSLNVNQTVKAISNKAPRRYLRRPSASTAKIAASKSFQISDKKSIIAFPYKVYTNLRLTWSRCTSRGGTDIGF